MLIAIVVSRDAAGRLRALAPGLQNCALTGATEQELLPRLRLSIEGELTRLLLAGAALPDARNGAPPPDYAAPAGARWLHVDINMGHLEALARHQSGR